MAKKYILFILVIVIKIEALQQRLLSRLVLPKTAKLFARPFSIEKFQEINSPTKHESVRTHFDKKETDNTILLRYSTSLVGQLGHISSSQTDCSKFPRLSRELRESLEKEIRALALLYDGKTLKTDYIERTVKILPISFQIHFANIINDLYDKALPYEKQKCESKCPIITARTNFEQSDNFDYPDFILTLFVIEELCRRTSAETKNIQSLIGKQFGQMGRAVRQFQADEILETPEKITAKQKREILKLLGGSNLSNSEILAIKQNDYNGITTAYYDQLLKYEDHPRRKEIAEVLEQAFNQEIDKLKLLGK